MTQQAEAATRITALIHELSDDSWHPIILTRVDPLDSPCGFPTWTPVLYHDSGFSTKAAADEWSRQNATGSAIADIAWDGHGEDQMLVRRVLPANHSAHSRWRTFWDFIVRILHESSR